VNYILDCDVRAFFESVSHQWLVRFVEHRIGDPRVIRLIRKWLKAGVLEDGRWAPTESGTPQGSVVSPTLANIYLHYSFDLWAERWRHRKARGNVIYVRYADDITAGFEYEDDAQRFLAELRERLSQFALTLHPEKTRLIEFGRFASENRARRGLGKPETFDFLGFKHICGRSRAGYFQLKRKSRRDRMRVKLKALKIELLQRRHDPIPVQGRWLAQVVRGYLADHAVPTNSRSLYAFVSMWSSSGAVRFGVVARRITRRGSAWVGWRPPFCLFRISSIPGRTTVSLSLTQGGSRVPELGSLGFVRGALSDGRSYRDHPVEGNYSARVGVSD